MANPEQVVRGVRFDKSFDVSSLRIDDELGFLTVPDMNEAGRDMLLGFGSAFDRRGGFITGDVTDPILALDELPEE